MDQRTLLLIENYQNYLQKRAQDSDLQYLQMFFNEKIKREQEKTQKLLHLLHNLRQERDEARKQTQILLQRLAMVTEINKQQQQHMTNSSVSVGNNVRYYYSLIEAQLLKNRALPERGRLVEAVTDAGRGVASALFSKQRQPYPELCWSLDPLSGRSVRELSHGKPGNKEEVQVEGGLELDLNLHI